MDGNVLWKIHYVSKEYGLSFLKVDAINGDILNHSHNIKLIDN